MPDKPLKAVVLLGTLKKEGVSNTEVLSQFLIERMRQSGIDCLMIKLVEHNIAPGTYSDMGPGDDWPRILEQILASDIIIFATPIWWDNHSSEIQKVIERLDELHDEILQGKKSRLEGKVGAIVITGDSDGAQHIIGNITNFFNAIGIIVPPYGSLSVLWEAQSKGKPTTPEELRQKYAKDYEKTAQTLIEGLVKYAKINQ